MSLSAATFGTWLQDTLGQFGIKGQLAILFIVFFVDAVLFPMLPEAFVVFFYQAIPTFDTRFSARADLVLTASVILLVVLAAEVFANAFLYGLVKWKGHRLPRRLTRAMNKWREFLLVSDERCVLLNRVVPILPFTGAFMAVSPWSPRKAMGYLMLGGALKYGALIGVVASAGLVFDPAQTWWVSLGLVAVILLISAASHGYLRRRLRQKLKAIPEHLPHPHLPHPHLPHLHRESPAPAEPDAPAKPKP